LYEGLENCELDGSCNPDKEIHRGGASVEGLEEAASLLDQFFEILDGDGFVELQLGFD
jgi:hypothetical protein